MRRNRKTRVALAAAATAALLGLGVAPASADGDPAEPASDGGDAVSTAAVIYTNDQCGNAGHRCFILEYTVYSDNWGTGTCFTTNRSLPSHTSRYDSASGNRYYFQFERGVVGECAAYGSGDTRGVGQSIRNNAAFGYNKDTWCHAVFYHVNYEGAYIVYPPNSAGLLGSLRNDNASSLAWACDD